MAHRRTWTVEITITEDEEGSRTHADATLSRFRPSPREAGDARQRSSDQKVPEGGDELATARALLDLAYKALDVSTGDIEQFTHRPMRLLS